MSAANPSPPKLKAALTDIQKAITSLETDDSGDNHLGIETIARQASLAFQLLLACELASRGVLVPVPVPVADVVTGESTATATATASSLLTNIRDSAGRVSIDDVSGGNYPAPMMAYLNAAAGMAAGACASSLHRLADEWEADSFDISSSSPEFVSSLFLPMGGTCSESWKEATKRCVEVHDGRFYSLLRLAAECASSSSDESKNNARETLEKLRRLKHHMNSISYSSYFYGAEHFAKDQPQLWKRCLDVALSMNEDDDGTFPDRVHGPKLSKSSIQYKAYATAPQTVWPLTNMIRIAHSKGNEKRSNELQLFLAAGCIAAVSDKLERMKRELEGVGSGGGGGSDDDGTHTDSTSMEKRPLGQLIQQYFLHWSRSIAEMDQMTLTTLLTRADLELSKCPSPEDGFLSSKEMDVASYETWLFQKYLQQHLRNLHRESDVWMEVQLRRRAMLNRLPEGGAVTLGSSKGRGGISKTTSSGGKGISLSSGKASKGSISGTKTLSTKSSIGGRGGLPTSSTEGTSLQEMEMEARANLYWETWKQSKLNFIEWESLFVTSLRDAMVQLPSLPAPPSFDEDESCPWFVPTELVRDCYEAITHQIQHLVDNATTVQKHLAGKKENKSTLEDVSLAWRGVLAFVSPLLNGHLFEILPNASSSPLLSSPAHRAFRRFVEECAKSVITATWMYEPLMSGNANEGRGLPEDVSRLISISHECLAASQKSRLSEEQVMTDRMKDELSSGVGGGASTLMTSARDSYADDEKKEIFQLECALASTKCRMDLENSVCDVDGEELVSTDSLAAVARKATMAATKTHQLIGDLKVSSSLALTSRAQFGVPYLQALSAWSGMYLTPWPFCTIGQARTILRNAREGITAAGKAWGRPADSKIEQIFLDTAEADLEGGVVGGFVIEAERLYKRVLDLLAEDDVSLESYAASMLKTHCLLGLGKLYLHDAERLSEAEAFARNALDILSSLDPTQRSCMDSQTICTYPWNNSVLNKMSHSFHMCMSRQFVAEACIRSSRYDDAKLFLSEAVKDLPGNFDAAFALASFHLRMMFDSDADNCGNNDALARTLLLKAAKMDTTRSGPFALLGVWYESQNDEARAKGCYQKALAIDPSHPVAGRGLKRILSLDELQPFCEKATKQNSPVNGWAWRCLGQKRSWVDGEDSSAVICFQQALRCRDIQGQGSDSHEVFYLDPKNASIVQVRESGETWGELANCYRRLGKYSAAARAYEEASIASDGCLSPSTHCAWAQVQLDLGLYDEAAEKCDVILSSGTTSPIHRMVAYIESEALLAMAKQDVQEGKFGLCLSHLQKGIDRLNSLSVEFSSSENFYCVTKLLGDLYTFAESLPSYVFIVSSFSEETHDEESTLLSHEVQNQMSFIAKGEEAYMMAQKLAEIEGDSEDDYSYLVASAASDLGTNLLAQARVCSSALGEGSGGGTKTSMFDMAARSGKIMDLIRRSINSYTKAIDMNPHDSSAWNGLGAALATVDPLLSQHAFCRALQIDKMLADPLSNIGMMYADFGKIDTSSEVLDALTQVADTPLMWVGRGLLLEKSSIEWKGQEGSSEACMIKAADAYRAALQIMQNPAALMGLSLTCRRSYNGFGKSSDTVYSYLSDKASKSESTISMKIHQNLTGSGNLRACYLDSLMTIEEGLERLTALDDSESLSIIKAGKSVLASIKRKTEMSDEFISPHRKTEFNDVPLPTKTSFHPRMTGKFPSDLVDVVNNESVPDAVECDLPPDTCNIYDARNNALLNPETGEAWLQYAKTLLNELSFATSSSSTEVRESGKMTDEFNAVKDAAAKALQLLQNRVLHASLITPRRLIHQGTPVEYSEKSVVSSIPSTTLISEAKSLLSWVEDVASLNRGDPCSRASYFSLQESLLLDPSNVFAMEALQMLDELDNYS